MARLRAAACKAWTGNGVHALHVSGGAITELHHCHVWESGKSGILVEGAHSKVTVSGGTVCRNRGHGIHVINGAAAYAHGCSIRRNGKFGVHASGIRTVVELASLQDACVGECTSQSACFISGNTAGSFDILEPAQLIQAEGSVQ